MSIRYPAIMNFKVEVSEENFGLIDRIKRSSIERETIEILGKYMMVHQSIGRKVEVNYSYFNEVIDFEMHEVFLTGEKAEPINYESVFKLMVEHDIVIQRGSKVIRAEVKTEELAWFYRTEDDLADTVKIINLAVDELNKEKEC